VVEANSAARARKSLAATTRQNAGRIFILERKAGFDRILDKLLKVNGLLASHGVDRGREISGFWGSNGVFCRRRRTAGRGASYNDPAACISRLGLLREEADPA
jgi:hypothetical protein